MAVLRGNLAPRGAVIKHAAASPALLTHTGRAVVFDSLEDLAARGDDPALDVKADDILVLRNAGPKGAPGMPEAGSFPIPMKLARAGVKDMIRISDARMSGTAFGTIVLHVAPEAAVGGPLALVKTGDRISLDVPKRRLELLVERQGARGPPQGMEGARAARRQRPRLRRPVPEGSPAGRRRRRFRFPRSGGRKIVSDAKLPGISVVVTCYNCRDYIGDAIRSVARQTLRDFECVIVDDASTDDSAEVVRRTLDELGDPRFSQIRLEKNVGQTGATRRGLAATKGDLRLLPQLRRSVESRFPRAPSRRASERVLRRGLHRLQCAADRRPGQADRGLRLLVRQGARQRRSRPRLRAHRSGARAQARHRRASTAEWQKQTPYRLYTKRVVHWVWVSTSSMMFRRSLIDLVFPEDDETFRLHMDFYVVVMAQMVAGSLLIDEALYSYRLHGRNGAADNPVLGGRLHLSSRNWGNTYAEMLDRMLSALQHDRERFIGALGDRQYRRLLLRMKAARAAWPASWLFVARSWLV